MADIDRYRLPRNIAPRHYALRLVPDLEGATFTGRVAIDVEVFESATQVVLNALELEIDEASIAVGGTTHAARVALDDETERAVLTVDDALPIGPATVHVAFRGVLNDKLRGFYRSTFVDDSGAERAIATTQFEATDARRAFPCWDEPDRKATFAVTLDVPSDLFAVSNAAEVSREPLGDGHDRVVFAPTMVMSTYLVAFVVGPLEATDPIDVDGVPLRIVHRAGQGHLTDFALESGAFALRFFTEYFGVRYPGDKLDLVAVPDFAFGAMENLGCVTFRDALLIVDPESSTQPELQRVADVIHHEIAHMWFGDLVTMKWWNGIWLNEAFATFMEMLCTDAFRPDWDRWTDFGISRSAAYDTDALSSTRPIEFEVVSPADAEGMFDVLTYEKGAAVVRMLEQYLGADRFREGIRRYIGAHAYGNTETTDLWDAIEEATGEPVRRIMDSWIFQGGHPSVAVSVEGSVAHLDQQRFSYDTGDESPGTHWSVPVLLRSGSVSNADRQARDGSRSHGGSGVDASSVQLSRTLLEGANTTVELDVAPDWVLVNSGGSGFYRVRYSPDGLRAAAAAPGLAPIERYGLLDDAWASALAGDLGVGAVVDLLRRGAEETDASVWQRAAGVIGQLDRLIDDAHRPDLQAWVRALVAPALRRVGFDRQPGETDRTAARRATLFTVLGTTGADPEARERAEGLVLGSLAGDDVDADLLDAAVKVAAATGKSEMFDRFRGLSADSTTPQARLRYLGALADFPGDHEADAFVAIALSDEVRTQDAPFVIRRSLTNRSQAARTFASLSTRWDDATARFPSNSISRMLEGIRTVTDPDLAAAIESFLDDHPVPQGERPIAQHRERMRAGVAMRRRVAGELAAAVALTD